MINGQVFPDISQIVGPYNGVLLDAYGVFSLGGKKGLIPYSKETMEYLVRLGKIVGILSNSSQLASKEIDKYKTLGLIEGKHYHFLLTSGEVAKNIFTNQQLPFKTPNKKYYVFGDIHPKYASPHLLFNESPYEATSNLKEADFIYISIPHIDGLDQTDPMVFKQKILHVLDSKLPMVCANPDRFAHEGDPAIAVVRQGSIGALYEQLGGIVHYIGKPTSEVYSIAMQKFQSLQISDPKNILMVGDTPETDIRGAKNFGMPSALVIRTGIMGDRISAEGDKCLQELPLTDQPNYLVERFAKHGL